MSDVAMVKVRRRPVHHEEDRRSSFRHVLDTPKISLIVICRLSRNTTTEASDIHARNFNDKLPKQWKNVLSASLHSERHELSSTDAFH